MVAARAWTCWAKAMESGLDSIRKKVDRNYVFKYESENFVPTDGAKLMRCDFVTLIEGAQICPTSCLGACVSEETAPLKIVIGVVLVTMSLTLKLEQRSMIYQDKG